MSKECVDCGKIFFPTDYRQKFCSRSCAAKFNNRIKKHESMVECLSGCGKRFQYRKNQSYCSFRCRQADLFKKFSVGEWAPTTKEFPTWLRERLIKNGCVVCGWNKINLTTGKSTIQIDHIDGNSSNHNYSNIRALCPNCHSLTSTYGGLNKGNGRKHRYSAVS